MRLLSLKASRGRIKQPALNTAPGLKPGLRYQSGVATLFTTMVLLIGITLLTLNSTRMSALELIVSDNFERRNTAFNHSESGLDALFSITKNVVDLNAEDGHSYCTQNNSDLGACSEVGITSTQGWPDSMVSSEVQAKITLDGKGCAPRWLSTSCSGVVEFAQYTFRSDYDDTASKGSKAQTLMGAMELIF